MSQSGHKAMAEGSLEDSRSVESSTSSAAREGSQCCGGDSAGGSEYFSDRIQSVIKSTSEYETAVEAEIESSKVHWSELREVECDKQRCLEADKAFFRSLQQQSVGSEMDNFFRDWSERRLELGEKIAEGAQGGIYRLKDLELFVMKVFKLEEGFNLEALHKQWPRAMLKSIHNDALKALNAAAPNLSQIAKGVLLEDGRFGFIMRRYWGDLRKMIDKRMIHNGNQASPFPDWQACHVMYRIALAMRDLHGNGIVHGDLKASNVLILPDTWIYSMRCPEFDLLQCTLEFQIIIADFECSVGVVGTRFWRAPEILTALKNRCFEPNLCTEKSDVYSFGMTCYEVLTGKIPLEAERANDYDIVLGGKRPQLPRDTCPWIRSMLERCWYHEPAERPSFEEIVEKFGVINALPMCLEEPTSEAILEIYKFVLNMKF